MLTQPARNKFYIVLAIVLLACAAFVLFSSTAVKASNQRDFSNMYSDATLTHVKTVYGKHIHGMLFDDINAYLSPEQKTALRDVKLDMPLYQSKKDLFDFSMQPANGHMTIPALSVKFLDDAAIARTWLQRNKCDPQAVNDYVAIAYYGQKPIPSILKALNIPKNALDDPYVDNVSQQMLKSAMAFLTLHELGHYYYQHKHYNAGLASQQEESQADAFAIDVMAKMKTIPMGMALWFSLITPFDQNSDVNYSRTHPPTIERLAAIAESIKQNPARFLSFENRNSMNQQQVLYVADQISQISRLFSNDSLRQLMRMRGQRGNLQVLKQACNPAQYQKSWLKILAAP